MSEMAETQFDSQLPNFIPMYIEQAKFDDESAFIQYGQFDEYDYIEMDLRTPKPSMYDDWPANYKFTGIELWYGTDLKKRTRQNYSLQQWLAEVGGLFNALRLIAMALAYPMAQFSVRMQLLTKLFRFLPKTTKPSNRDYNKDESLTETAIQKDKFDRLELFRPWKFVHHICFWSRADKRRRKMIARAD